MAIVSMPKVESFPLLSQHEFDYLNSERSLMKKIYIMEDMLSLTREEHRERQAIVNDLFQLLQPYYPQCDILVFGSSANGFGFRGCDLDLLFLPFPEYCNLDFQGKGSGAIPSAVKILKGKESRQKLYNMDETMHLKFVRSVFYRTNRYFKRIQFIPAKCPILNIEFVNSPIHCDFSSSNRLVAYNTQLLWVYGKLDARVRPLVMFIRYWAKSLGFISKTLLSSYSLTLLVIFYLQNTNPAVLPSVKQLNELAGYNRIIDGWETAICVEPALIKSNMFENNKPITEILISFFGFYWNFDFVQDVVSVYYGRPLPVKLLKESEDQRVKNFQVTPFSIQDPFILSKNVSRNSTMKTPFKIALLIAKDFLCRNNSQFQLLFDPYYYEAEITAMFAPTKEKLSTSPTFFTVQLTYDLYKKLGLTSHLQPWFDKVSQSLIDILQHGLLLDCEVIDKENLDHENRNNSAKKRKFSVHNTGNLKLFMSIQCIANFPTVIKHYRYLASNHLQKTPSTNEDSEKRNEDSEEQNEDSDIEIPTSLKNDYKISKELTKKDIRSILKLPENDFPPPCVSFICDCFHYPESQISDVVVAFKPLTNQLNFHSLKNFLKSFVQKHLKIILEETET